MAGSSPGLTPLRFSLMLMNIDRKPSMDLTTSYKILGIDPQADEDSVKRAYKAQVRRWHPDQFPKDSSLKASAEEQLKQINIAYARVKTYLALHHPKPADKTAKTAPHSSPDDLPGHEAPSEQPPNRSWVDHLFDTLNAFAGNRADASQAPSKDQDKAKRKRSFEDVLGEMTGHMPPSNKKQGKTAGQYTRPSYAEIYKKYRRQGSSVEGVDSMESKGPVKPVSRVRGIGKSR